MTRREFLGKAVKIAAVTAAAAAVIWAAVRLVQHPASFADLGNAALSTLLVFAAILVWVAISVGPPMAMGALGYAAFRTRPRLTGAVAGAAGFALACALGALLAPALRHSTTFAYHRPGWLGYALELAWWVWWGGVGGTLAERVRARWRKGRGVTVG